MQSKKMSLSLVMAVLASAVIQISASASDVNGGARPKVNLTTSDKPASPLAVTHLYLVKNENGYVNALTEAELDTPAKITRLGNARRVSYGGHMVDVETTIVMQGTHVSTISTATAQGDSQDE